MGGLRVNIQTGEIIVIHDKQLRVRKMRQCIRLDCRNEFEVHGNAPKRFCSISCSKRGQNNRLGQKHTPATIEKMKEVRKAKVVVKPPKVLEIVPHARIRNRVTSPRFVKDPYQWANAVYGRYHSINKTPKKSTNEYGLYLYGEWLFNNETFEQTL